MTSKDMARPEPVTGAASVQRLREEERDKIHAERALAAEVAAELKKENKKKKKSGKRNTASSK
tara:strand:- start:316 stop:504 length:189 start_codon:yes stop_codon:yes gene_type:complete